MSDVPHIIIKFNMAVIKDVPLAKDETSIGRKPENDIHLDNQAVSGSHCKIRKDGDNYVIVDMDSTNGTFVNGRKITRETLKHKDQIRIARYSVDFLWESKAGEESPQIEIMTNTPTGQTPTSVLPLAADIEKSSAPFGVPPPATAAPATAAPEAAKAEEPSQIGATLKGDRVLPPAAGILKVISGGEGQTEIKLTELMTYIGTSNQAAIKIKGFMAPELAAAISRRPDGYFLKAVKPGYPKVNGISVSDQIFLESGALIEVGSVNMVFYVDDPKKKG